MKNSVFILITLFSTKLFPQPVSINEAVLMSNDRSYISVKQGIGYRETPDGTKSLEQLIFEAQIAPTFFIRFNKKSTFGMAMSPKVVIRMFQENSSPVRTPSYMPNIILYHQIKFRFLYKSKLTNWLFTKERVTYMTYKFCHYSNGQNGDFFIPGTNEINFENGNFSTNYAEIGFNWTTRHNTRIGWAALNGRIAFERHFDFGREDKMNEVYYYNRLFLENIFVFSNVFRTAFIYSFMTGKGAFTTKHSLDILVAYRPFINFSDFSFFVRGYLGPDYYNLRYVNSLRVITFGIMADPLGIPLFKE